MSVVEGAMALHDGVFSGRSDLSSFTEEEEAETLPASKNN